jgi:predicted Zn-dependent peptidase
MPNGAGVYVYETTQFKTVLLRVVLQASLDDTTSLTALLPFVLRRGTREFPGVMEITRHLEEMYGASFGIRVEKVGERLLLSFRLEVADPGYLPGGHDLVEQALDFLRDVIFDPALTEKKLLRTDYVRQERENLTRLVQGLVNDRDGYAIERCLQNMCETEPFGRFEYGCEEDLGPIRPIGLTKHWRHLLEVAPMDVYVVGRVGTVKVERLVRERFGHQRRQPVQLPRSELRPAPRRPRRVEEKLPVKQARLVMGYRCSTPFKSRGYPAVAVMNAILGGTQTSKLFRTVREKESLVYSIFSLLEKEKGLMLISAGTDLKKVRKVETLVRKELDGLRRGDVTADEIRFAKNYLENQLRGVEDSPSTLCHFDVERRLGGRPESPQKAASSIAAVTRGAIAEAARGIQLDTIYLLRE